MMMRMQDWMLTAVEGLSWYAFMYYLLYSIKNPVVLWQSAFVLLLLMYIAGISCPLVRFSRSWQRMWE